MKLQVIKPFKDKEAKKMRRKGDVFEANKARAAELLRIKVNPLVVEVDKGVAVTTEEGNEVVTDLETTEV